MTPDQIAELIVSGIALLLGALLVALIGAPIIALCRFSMKVGNKFVRFIEEDDHNP